MPDILGLLEKSVTEPLVGQGLRIATILLVSYLLYRVVGALSYRLVHRSQQDAGLDRDERRKRSSTLIGVARTAFTAIIFAVATLMILKEVGYNVLPLLAGASFVGAAIGFGSQYLVRDLISGFFILLENQYRVGDEVSTNSISGTVESIGLRTTTLKDINGDVHVISNGTIELSTNMTRGMGQALVDVRVPHGERLDRVYGVLEGAGEKLRNDPQVYQYVIEQPEILGIVDLGETGVTVRMVCKSQASGKWAVARKLRRLIKEHFDAEGISVPSPRPAAR